MRVFAAFEQGAEGQHHGARSRAGDPGRSGCPSWRDAVRVPRPGSAPLYRAGSQRLNSLLVPTGTTPGPGEPRSRGGPQLGRLDVPGPLSLRAGRVTPSAGLGPAVPAEAGVPSRVRQPAVGQPRTTALSQQLAGVPSRTGCRGSWVLRRGGRRPFGVGLGRARPGASARAGRRPAFQAVPAAVAPGCHAEVGAVLSGWGWDVRSAERLRVPVWRPAFQAVRAAVAPGCCAEVGAVSFRVGLRRARPGGPRVPVWRPPPGGLAGVPGRFRHFRDWLGRRPLTHPPPAPMVASLRPTRGESRNQT